MRTPIKALNFARSHAAGGMIGILLFLCSAFPLVGATFTNSASIQVSDPSSSLTSTSGVFTVSCWFRISIPSSLALSDNMDILMDRSDGNESANFSYLIRYNYTNNAIEFVTHGSSSSPPPYVLIQNPFLERWYHVAVSRSGSVINCYVDGRAVLPGEGAPVGSTTGSGLAIGGINGNSKQFFGDLIEVAVYSSALNQGQIQSRMFVDQRDFANLKGYFKLGYSTNSADFYHNFASPPPAGTDPATPIGSGSITFGQVDQAGEQSLFDANLNHGQNALTPLSGAYAWNQTLLARAVPGIAFDLEIGYSSAISTTPPSDGSADPFDQRILGNCWRESFDARVTYGPGANNLDELDVINWDGSVQAWTRSAFGAPLTTRANEYRGELVQFITNTSPDVQWTTPARLVYLFHDPGDENNPVMAGRLEQVTDFNGNLVHIQWDENEGLITNIVDSVGGNYHFNYDPQRQLLTNVTFGSWQINFGYDTNNRLTSKALTNTASLYTAVNTTWQFQYNAGGLLQQIIDPRGNTNTLVQYDQYGRQTNEVDALNRATRTEYDVPATWQMRRTDAGGFQWVETYDHKGHVLVQSDPLGNATSYTYNTNGNRTSITEPLGWMTSFGYDSRANVIASTNALGLVSHWVMDAFFNKAVQAIDPTGWTNFYVLNETNGNLVSHYDALGTLVSYTYSTNGLVLSSTDADGHTTSYSYDTNGFLTAKTDPETNVTGYSYNDVGWKLADTNALKQVTTYAYDLDGDVVQAIDPINRTYTKTYDANGNLLSASDAKGQLTTFGYDAANQKTDMVDRTRTNQWNYFYTSRGKLDHATDPLGNSTTNTYDAANRVVTVSDPLGNAITNIYDADGSVTTMVDQLGQPWSKTYDRLDRVIASADPQGNITKTSFDADGRVFQITTPNGYPSIHSYDGRGRLVKWVDAQNFQWQYAYDGVGNITNITDALGGHYLMAYGFCNERVFEQNQDSNIWRYAYDSLLRLKQKTDPNGTTRTMIYDSGGRVIEVDYSTGRVDAFVYDANDNPINMSRSGSGPATLGELSYDVMDRVAGYMDAFGNNIGYTYDAVGRRNTLKYPDGKILTYNYDALNRLTNQVDWAGRQLNYTYDKAGRLLTRTYPNSIVQSNAFDNAGRITGLSYIPPNPNPLPITAYIALTYAYDLNGNKTGSTEQGTLAWPMPSLHNESSSYTPVGKLTARTDALSATNNFTYQYDSSGNMTNAISAGQSYALTYDEDNRTMSIQWSLGALMDETISNRYDVLGRRVSKTAAEIETRYALDLGGGMERVLCDMNSSVITGWYVYGPDLCYKVDATNGLTCYHADAMGNVIAITDGNTNLISEYAYTPYGRSLSSTNSQLLAANSYTFVGSQGVMEDLPDLYFMRARYYSADASAFLSTDPVKHIGSGWKPNVYVYANNNPLSYIDPRASSSFFSSLISFASSVLNVISSVLQPSTPPNSNTPIIPSHTIVSQSSPMMTAGVNNSTIPTITPHTSNPQTVLNLFSYSSTPMSLPSSPSFITQVGLPGSSLSQPSTAHTVTSQPNATTLNTVAAFQTAQVANWQVALTTAPNLHSLSVETQPNTALQPPSPSQNSTEASDNKNPPLQTITSYYPSSYSSSSASYPFGFSDSTEFASGTPEYYGNNPWEVLWYDLILPVASGAN